MSGDARKTAEGLAYLSGFGNEHSSEAVTGALPEGRNSPQRAPLGLYAEQLSGTAFTEPRAHNRRSWLYRIRPSAAHPAFTRAGNGAIRTAPFAQAVPDPNRLRWNPLPEPAAGTDFVAGHCPSGRRWTKRSSAYARSQAPRTAAGSAPGRSRAVAVARMPRAMGARVGVKLICTRSPAAWESPCSISGVCR